MLSANGLGFIQKWEKCRLAAFKPTPQDVWTIGWGHTEGVQMGDTCTQEQADAWFAEDTSWVNEALNAGITILVNQNEFDACGSLYYDIGSTEFEESTLLRLLNAGQFNLASQQFARWNKQKGKVLDGLTNRREQEAALFNMEVANG